MLGASVGAARPALNGGREGLADAEGAAARCDFAGCDFDLSRVGVERVAAWALTCTAAKQQ